jgi:hypothetical protein
LSGDNFSLNVFSSKNDTFVERGPLNFLPYIFSQKSLIKRGRTPRCLAFFSSNAFPGSLHFPLKKRVFRALHYYSHKAFPKRKSPMQIFSAQGFELTIFSYFSPVGAANDAQSFCHFQLQRECH